MTENDIARCAEIRNLAGTALRASMGLPPAPLAHGEETVAHLLRLDPEGSTVATDETGIVIGFSQAAQRDELWILAHLFIDPLSLDPPIGVGGRRLSGLDRVDGRGGGWSVCASASR